MLKEIRDNVKKNVAKKEWFILSLSFLAFFLPIHKKMAALGVVLIIIATILDHSKKRFQIPLMMIFMILLFIYHPIWLMGIEDVSTGLREMETKLSLLIFPVLAIFAHRISRKDLHWLFGLFTLGIVVYACGTLLFGGLKWIVTGKSNYIVYWRLAHYFHPTYLGFYANIGLGFLGLLLFQNKLLFKNKQLHFFSIFILTVYVVLLTSKAAIITMVIILTVAFFWALKRKISPMIFVGLFILIGVVGYFNPEFNSRVKEFVNVTNTTIIEAPSDVPQTENNSETKPKPIAKSSTGIRLLTWKSSITLLKNNPWGVGTGMVTPKLTEIYHNKGETFVEEKQFNSHNQYLQFGVEFGYLGIITLILFVLSGLILGVKRQNRLLVLLVSLIGVNMLFESFLELQAGVISVGYFLFILVITDLRST